MKITIDDDVAQYKDLKNQLVEELDFIYRKYRDERDALMRSIKVIDHTIEIIHLLEGGELK